MLRTARQWGDLGGHAPDACANIAMNPRRPVARFLGRDELQRLGAVLDRHAADHPWPVAAIRLLTLTGARLSEVLNLRWEEIGGLLEDGASARLGDSKTGPRTLWLGPEAVAVLTVLPREEGGLHGVRLHDARHTYASQGVMNGVGLTAVGKLLGHRKRTTTAIYAHLDDAALRDAAAQAATVIARAMGYRSAPPTPPAKTGGWTTSDARPESHGPTEPAATRTRPPSLRIGRGDARSEDKLLKGNPRKSDLPR